MNTYISYGKFSEKNPSDYSEEVQNLYKTKDDHNRESINIDDFNRVFYHGNPLVNMFHLPSNPYYWKLTHNERIEKGLPPLRQVYSKTIFGLWGLTIFATVAMHQYNKIYSPMGVIIRRSQQTTWTRYFR